LTQKAFHHISEKTIPDAVHETGEEMKFDINLRSSCLDCQFLVSCPIAEKEGTPKSDVLVGTYSLKALKKGCLV
jgi:hypothetical protein